MRVRTDEATAAQLRSFYMQHTGAFIHETAGAKVVLRKLEMAGFHDEEFDLDEEGPLVVVDEAPEDATADAAIAALVATGTWSEEDARKLVGGNTISDAGPKGGLDVEKRLVEMGYSRRAARKVAEFVSMDELDRLPPRAERHWVTIQLQAADKDDPTHQFVATNGVAQFLPRGETIQVRVPFLNNILDAEEIQYDPVIIDAEKGVRLRGRRVEKYPVVYLTKPRATKLEASAAA